MKQQTAMQILLDSINKELESNKIKDLEYYGALEDVKDYILDNFLLEKEREQIMNAWYNGFEENRPYVDHSEDYYNETYKQD